MKILSAEQIREADRLTIANEPIVSLDLMERASLTLIEALQPYLDREKTIHIFCGSGNNGGDGLAIARLLQEKEFQVAAYFIALGRQTDDCTANIERFDKVNRVHAATDFPILETESVVIDALLGAGTSRAPSGLVEAAIRHINRSKATVYAIDLPSGLPVDFLPDWECVQADRTFTFQSPKLTFFLKETAHLAGSWEVLDIGLDKEAMRLQQSGYYYLDPATIQTLVKPRERFSHKGTYGHGLLVAGSKGKNGAAVLSARAALRSGIGLLTAHIPADGYIIFQTAVPEAMCLTDEQTDYRTDLTTDLSPYSAIGVGPGIGTAMETLQVVRQVITANQKTVFDADALNLLAVHRELLQQLPEASILTPHVKEFERLAGMNATSLERLELLRRFSTENRCVVVLKDAITAIAEPSGTIWFNMTGNPGMATGGSGDVLTGILLGLLAQGYSAVEAAQIGVYFHGKAGDAAAERRGEPAVIASDLIDQLRIGTA